jgi:hypothetical protein
VLRRQRWDYRKGASLRTYFIGQCLSRFANVYRRWYTNEQNNHYLATDDDEVLVYLGPKTGGTDSRAVGCTASSPEDGEGQARRDGDETHGR